MVCSLSKIEFVVFKSPFEMDVMDEALQMKLLVYFKYNKFY